MASPFFQILCVCKFTSKEGARYDWTFGTAVGIAASLTERLDEIKKVSPRKFDHTVNWVLPGFWDHPSFKLSQLGPPELQPWDVIVYFLPTRERSLVHKVTRELPPKDKAGFTSTSPKGIIAEVYLENNMPGELLGNHAMHEIMHVKLDVGQTLKPAVDVHELNPGEGISDTKRKMNEKTKFTPEEKRQMALHLFDPVEIFTDGN